MIVFKDQIELQKMNDKQLYHHFKEVRKEASFILHYYGRRCCEFCHHYTGDNWEEDVGQHLKPVEEYLEIVKAILSTRNYNAAEDRSTKKKRRVLAKQHYGQNKSKNR